MKESSSEFLTLRGRRVHIRRWGTKGAPPLFLLHGWMDVAATFQFVVDALQGEWQVIAPDWRGFGASEWNRDVYWFADYLADLDALLRHYSAGQPVSLVGHSMGGNVAGLYAGVRPERVASLALLEGFGLAPVDAAEAPARYRQWLDQLHEPLPGRSYADSAELAARLCRDNPRLTPARAQFLARHLGVESDDGRIVLAADPYHRLVNPVLYRLEEAKASWRLVRAPVLCLGGADSFVMKSFLAHEDEYRSRLACFGSVREVILENAGHNMHHDQPEKVAAVIEEFFAA